MALTSSWCQIQALRYEGGPGGPGHPDPEIEGWGGGLGGLSIRSKIMEGGARPHSTGSATTSIGLINEFLVASLFKGNSQKGGMYPLILPIRGCAAGQGMVFDLSVLNRVCNFP